MLKFTFNLSGSIVAFALCVRSCGGILMSRGSKVYGEDSHFLLLLIGLISLLVRLFLIHSTVRCSLRPYLPCSRLKYLTDSKTLNSGPWWKLLSRVCVPPDHHCRLTLSLLSLVILYWLKGNTWRRRQGSGCFWKWKRAGVQRPRRMIDVLTVAVNGRWISVRCVVKSLGCFIIHRLQ